MLGITSSMSLIFLRFNYKNMNTDINFIKVEKKKKIIEPVFMNC